MFVIAGSEGNYYLVEDELKIMHESGRWEIQSHTFKGHSKINVSDDAEGYFLVNRKWLENEGRLETLKEYISRVEQDIIVSNFTLLNITGKVPNYFAFPYGEYGQHSGNTEAAQLILENILRKHYKFVFFQAWTEGEYNYNYPSQSAFYIKRIGVGDNWSTTQLIENLKKANPKRTNYQDEFAKDNGWLNPWGLFNIHDGIMSLKSNSNTSGALVYLDGSYHWSNYRLDTEFKLIKGETISLLTNFSDGNNYYACNFGEEYASISQNYNGVLKQIVVRQDSLYPLGNNALASMAVSDYKISCYWFGELVVWGDIDNDDAVNKGGVGVKVWSKELNNAEAEIDRIIVSSL